MQRSHFIMSFHHCFSIHFDKLYDPQEMNQLTTRDTVRGSQKGKV